MSFKLRAIQPKEFVGDEALTITTADSRYATKTELETKANQSDLQSLKNLVNLKADKNQVVDLTSEQNISGRKVFTTSAFFNSGQYFNDNQKYIDADGNKLHLFSSTGITMNTPNSYTNFLQRPHINGLGWILSENEIADRYQTKLKRMDIKLSQFTRRYNHKLAGVPNAYMNVASYNVGTAVSENFIACRIARNWRGDRWYQEVSSDWFVDGSGNLFVSIMKWYDSNDDWNNDYKDWTVTVWYV